jgi:hypothetical protein
MKNTATVFDYSTFKMLSWRKLISLWSTVKGFKALQSAKGKARWNIVQFLRS